MIIRNLIYILQGESYNLRRFLFFVYNNYYWWKLEQRQKIDWTIKVKLIYVSNLVFLCLLIIFLFSTLSFWSLILWPIIYVFLPIIISILYLIISPLDYLLKSLLISKARKALKRHSKLRVIGITGSYGKTSVKEILFTILSSKFKAIETPDNINTDLGIAKFIIDNEVGLAQADFFIVEMGAYQRDDIAKICDLVIPDYSILTGINESHLERFGNLENTIFAKFELAEHTNKLSVLNFNDENIRNNYHRFKINEVIGLNNTVASNIELLPNFSGLSFVFNGQNFTTKLLAKHNIDLIILALTLAQRLGVDNDEAVRAVSELDYVKHRLQPIFNNFSQVLVIDDSYNGNFQGFISGLEVLSRANGRKLIITPGLVELANKTEIRHREIANLYIKYKIDLVLLIKNSSTKFIIDEFQKKAFNNYRVYINSQEAHNNLKDILKAGDTIIFQNDWPDNYK
ncbi:UDP-N-acetylmuramoyl-tripeptide--D-alanyl-D-alanine ligase [Candidatus Falkowbacteria bacterium]|nr:UDP-N-acetylmuramoyl-tripeptide--D-alanyl-D-alanine ligase [Candidatus Falkowbacteria bacterium]NCT54561.1 UDP-N-acetylmuramoyl-tripeptide--D-alanyl-D-alanine ligase [Candidatus Falkowbacteria bacterium]